MHVARELMAMELGRLSLGILEGIYGSEFLDMTADHHAIRILQDIQNILNNERLTDFCCVEEIVSLLERSGISTTRHDFG